MARIRMVKEWEINGFLFAKGVCSVLIFLSLSVCSLVTSHTACTGIPTASQCYSHYIIKAYLRKFCEIQALVNHPIIHQLFNRLCTPDYSD